MTLKEFDLLRGFVIFTMIACFIVCMIMIPVSASAAESDFPSPFVDLSPYGFIVTGDPWEAEYGDSTIFSIDAYGTTKINLKLPNEMSIGFIDIIVYMGDGGQPDVSAFVTSSSGTNQNLSVQRFGPSNNFFRFYGKVSGIPRSPAVLPISFTNPTQWGPLYPTILSAKVSASQDVYESVTGTWNVYSDHVNDSGSLGSNAQTDWATPVNSSGGAGTLTISIPASEWLAFDFLNVTMFFDVPEINSISANAGNGFISIDHTYLDDNDYEHNHFLTLSLDLRNVKAANVTLDLFVDFQEYVGTVAYLNILDVSGWSEGTQVSDVSFWGRIIAEILNEKLDSLTNGTLTPDQDQASQEVLDKNEEFSSQIEVLSTVPKPDLNQIGSPSDLIEDINFIPHTQHLTLLTHSTPHRTIIFIAALFTLIGVVLHGRRQ